MDPIQIITYFVLKTAGYIKQGIDARRYIDAYKAAKFAFVTEKYKYKIIPLDFVYVRSSYFSPGAQHGGPGDYAHMYIKVDDIYPFVLNRNQIIEVKSIKGSKSQFDGLKLIIGYGYVMGPDGYYHVVGDNQAPLDEQGSFMGVPGLLDAVWCRGGSCKLEDRMPLGIGGDPDQNTAYNRQQEFGKAYTLAPGVAPNIITESLALIESIPKPLTQIIFGSLVLIIIYYITTKKK